MKEKTKNLFLIVFSLLPLGCMAYFFVKYAVNIPHWDDHALRAFILNFYKEGVTFSERIQLIFKLHNEHRIALTRIVSLIIFKIHGNLDYKVMMLVGDAFLVGIWVIFGFIVRKLKLSLIIFAAVSWLLFTPSLAENFFWGMASVQNFGVIFLAFFTFYLLVFDSAADMSLKRENNFKTNGKLLLQGRFWLAWTTAFLAVFTSGNGILVPILALFILIFQRKNTTAFVWFVTFGIVLFFYFLWNQTRSDAPVPAENQSIFVLLEGVLVLAGSAFDPEWFFPAARFFVAKMAGILLIGCAVWMFVDTLLSKPKFTESHKTQTLVLACLLFVAGTGIATVLSRMGYGIGIFLTSKYKLYGILLLILCLLFVAYRLPISRFRYGNWAILGLAVGLWLNGYFNDFQFIKNQYIRRTTDLMNWQLEAQTRGGTLTMYPYEPTQKMPLDSINFSSAQLDKSLIDDIQMQPTEIKFLEHDMEATEQFVYLLLKSEKKTIFTAVEPLRNASRIGIFKNYFQNGFSIEVSTYDVPTDIYQVYVLTRHNNQQRLYDTGKLLRINGIPSKRTEAPKNW